jgi:hypothetical protein
VSWRKETADSKGEGKTCWTCKSAASTSLLVWIECVLYSRMVSLCEHNSQDLLDLHENIIHAILCD